jgi:hypothetical protein
MTMLVELASHHSLNVGQNMRKNFIMVTAVFLFAACSATKSDSSGLCRKWTLDGGELSAITEFRSDGTVFVDHEDGPDIQGT